MSFTGAMAAGWVSYLIGVCVGRWMERTERSRHERIPAARVVSRPANQNAR